MNFSQLIKKGIISALIAGGGGALVVVVVICLIGLLCSSIFGIFFSSEDTGTITMSSVVKEINTEIIILQKKHFAKHTIVNGICSHDRSLLNRSREHLQRRC